MNRKRVSGKRVAGDRRARPTVGWGGARAGLRSRLLLVPKVSRTKVFPCHLEPEEVSRRARRAGSPVILPF